MPHAAVSRSQCYSARQDELTGSGTKRTVDIRSPSTFPSSFNAPDQGSRSAIMPQATPIVFVVDDDVSVRESLDLMIRWAGWQSKTFASAQEFLSRPARPGSELPDPRPQSSRPQRSRSAEARRQRPHGHAHHLHYGLRRCAGFGPGNEGGRCRVPDEAIQRRGDTGGDPTAQSSAAASRSAMKPSGRHSMTATRRSAAASARSWLWSSPAS